MYYAEEENFRIQEVLLLFIGIILLILGAINKNITHSGKKEE